MTNMMKCFLWTWTRQNMSRVHKYELSTHPAQLWLNLNPRNVFTEILSIFFCLMMIVSISRSWPHVFSSNWCQLPLVQSPLRQVRDRGSSISQCFRQNKRIEERRFISDPRGAVWLTLVAMRDASAASSSLRPRPAPSASWASLVRQIVLLIIWIFK